MDHSETRIIPEFVPSSDLLNAFRRTVNGNWLEHILRKAAGAAYSEAISKDLLAAVVDDALHGFFLVEPIQRNNTRGCLYREEGSSNTLLLAIKERLPRTSSSPEQIEIIARQVVDEIRQQLKSPQTRLVVGTGSVWRESGEWRSQGLEPT